MGFELPGGGGRGCGGDLSDAGGGDGAGLLSDVGGGEGDFFNGANIGIVVVGGSRMGLFVRFEFSPDASPTTSPLTSVAAFSGDVSLRLAMDLQVRILCTST